MKADNKTNTKNKGDEYGKSQSSIQARDPFSQEKLNDIFKVNPKYPDRLISRENSNIEFKESFGWKSLSKYFKTCAAFANAKGGYILFGIGRSPHKLMGLTGNALELFQNIDPEKITEYFNEHFSPEISWDRHEYELDGNTYGIIYVNESHDKPVVCSKDADNVLKEGDIYYRYRGRSERIKYSELRAILDLKRENEQRLWMQHLVQIARIGVRETGIFDLTTGQVTGANGAFLIDESLLSQLSFIKEGEFSEIKGKPALKLIGKVEVISDLGVSTGRKKIVKTKGIRTSDIVSAFLAHDKVDEPIEYLKQICFESTAFLPIYYFLHLGKVDMDMAVEIVNGVVSRNPAKTKLIQRLQKEGIQRYNLPKGDSESANKKRTFLQQLKQQTVNEGIINKDLEYCLYAIRCLTPDEVKQNSKYFRELLRTWFNRHYSSASSTLADCLRKGICWIDEALYSKE